MKILVVGNGGREHALIWKLAQSARKPEILCAPGNAGIAKLARCVDISATDIEKLADLAKRERVDLTIVGPEAPLCAGIVDYFEAKGLEAFGPKKLAAALEGDKVFAKEIMARHSIPTAAHRTFSELEPAIAYVNETVDYPMVVKASGLAAGKGVIICRNVTEAKEALLMIMSDRSFGAAGDRVVIEDFLEGEEASIIALTDGETICVLETSQDHKRAFDRDEGPNTGGMGAYSPAPVVTPKVQARIEEEILVPIVHAMKHERRPFKGVLYAGLMMTRKGPKVLEFNVRFGDPECQALLARLDCDLLELILACHENRLADCDLRWDPRPAITVVLAQKGYPGPVARGLVLNGLDKVDESEALLFHAGTGFDDQDRVVATGGRVLNVTALGETLGEARDRAYAAIAKMDTDGLFYRRDIGHRGLR